MAGAKFKVFVTRSYADQGKAFLNAYFEEHQKDGDNIWLWARKFAELDLEKKRTRVRSR